MLTIPAINETSFEEVKRKASLVAAWGSPWVHLDVVDGVFAPNITWNNPNDLAVLPAPLATEVHLMVYDPEIQAEKWLKAGVKRIVVHVEAVSNMRALRQLAVRYQAEVVLAASPATDVSMLFPFYPEHKFFQILAVMPGKAGQVFQEQCLEKVKMLRAKAPDATIEVDGGVNGEVARRLKEAGADIIVSSSYIFANEHPRMIYEMLSAL